MTASEPADPPVGGQPVHGEPDWEAALAALREAASDGSPVVLVAHVHPDGDSLGSALALALGLRAIGARPAVTFAGAPDALPVSLSFLPAQELIVAPAALPARPPLLVTLDAGSAARLGTLAPLVDAAGRVLVVDHHPSNTRFGDVNLVEPSVAATSVLALGLLDRLGVALDARIAAALYAGLASDTGSFKYESTSAEVHRIAARLLDTGIRPDAISRSLWDTHPLAYLRLLGDLLQRVRLEPDAGLVWTWCGQRELAGAGLAFDEIEGVIDVVRTTAEAQVAVVCKEDADGFWQVSVRSKGAVDVGAVCSALGGGGHRYAAGFTAAGPVPKIVDQLRRELTVRRSGTPRTSTPRSRTPRTGKQ